MRQTPTFTPLCAVACLLIAFGSWGGATVATPAPIHDQSPSALAADTALLMAVITSLPRRYYHQMQFDPRVIKDDPNAIYIHAPGDYVEVAGPVVEARATVIPRLNATRRAENDWFSCAHGPGGLGRADSAGLALRAHGPERPYCVVAGVPRKGGGYFPAGGIDERASAPAGAYTTRVATFDPGTDVVYDVTAIPLASGRWRVIESTVLYQSWS